MGAGEGGGGILHSGILLKLCLAHFLIKPSLFSSDEHIYDRRMHLSVPDMTTSRSLSKRLKRGKGTRIAIFVVCVCVCT